jgi:hypothetical protein
MFHWDHVLMSVLHNYSHFVFMMVVSKLCAWWRYVYLQPHEVSLFGPSIWWGGKVIMWFSSLQLIDLEWVSTRLCKPCTGFEQTLFIKVINNDAHDLFTFQLLFLTIYMCGAFEPSNQDCRLRDQSAKIHFDYILLSPFFCYYYVMCISNT